MFEIMDASLRLFVVGRLGLEPSFVEYSKHRFRSCVKEEKKPSQTMNNEVRPLRFLLPVDRQDLAAVPGIAC